MLWIRFHCMVLRYMSEEEISMVHDHRIQMFVVEVWFTWLLCLFLFSFVEILRKKSSLWLMNLQFGTKSFSKLCLKLLWDWRLCFLFLMSIKVSKKSCCVPQKISGNLLIEFLGSWLLLIRSNLPFSTFPHPRHMVQATCSCGNNSWCTSSPRSFIDSSNFSS